ncbi:hypothetical protein Poli38472_010426 [Pythium oligandrum]|uniref:Crinkler effector protein N-terminal domain-containing protein n=1 Tax=Pythium oligandrum TaxID=41045 RepID=A0A8K1FC71_PYTOL|nr:hypothetical protein Poli38472_010426 [Pythium oligandrum]|eukprot:TMW55544.1 hypothetical protein Poli38472_010426 [Pythium oligandrum]
MRTVFCLVLGVNDVFDLGFPDHAMTAELKYRLGDSVISTARIVVPAHTLKVYVVKADDGIIGLDPDHPDYAQLKQGNSEIEAKYMKDEMLLDSTHSIGHYFRGSRERAIHVLVKPIFRHGMGWTIHPDYAFLSLNATEPLILSSFRRPSENDVNRSKRLLKR